MSAIANCPASSLRQTWNKHNSGNQYRARLLSRCDTNSLEPNTANNSSSLNGRRSSAAFFAAFLLGECPRTGLLPSSMNPCASHHLKTPDRLDRCLMTVAEPSFRVWNRYSLYVRQSAFVMEPIALSPLDPTAAFPSAVPCEG